MTIATIAIGMRPDVDSWRARVNADVILLPRRRGLLIASLLYEQTKIHLLPRPRLLAETVDLHGSMKLGEKRDVDLLYHDCVPWSRNWHAFHLI